MLRISEHIVIVCNRLEYREEDLIYKSVRSVDKCYWKREIIDRRQNIYYEFIRIRIPYFSTQVLG